MLAVQEHGWQRSHSQIYSHYFSSNITKYIYKAEMPCVFPDGKAIKYNFIYLKQTPGI